MAGTPNTDGFRVVRPEWTTGGEAKRSPRYHVKFKDHLGTWRRVVAFTDQSASVAYGRRLRELADTTGAGEPIRGELARWVQGLGDDVLAKLLEWGILDRRATMALWPLAQHVEAWHESIVANGRTLSHADLLRRRLERLIAGCGFTRYADIAEADVLDYFTRRRAGEAADDAQRQDRLSAQSRKHYTRTLKQFCAWMVRADRATSSPVAGLEVPNVDADRRHRRRALTGDELRALVRATRTAGDWRGTTGVERAALYALAASTGLRAAEIRSLRRDSFELEGDAPAVTVEAASSKRRRRDVLPLTADVVGMLRDHLRAKLPAAAAFTVPEKTATMIRDDLTAARAAWLEEARTSKLRTERERTGYLVADDERGRTVDFHSLRVTFVTLLARAGVHPAVAQQLARHSDIRLTMGTYTDVGYGDQRAALGALPSMADAAG